MLYWLTILVAFTSVVYNLALAGSNTDAIVNVVILLFINDLDEKLLGILESISFEWTANRIEEVKLFMETCTNNAHSGSSLSAPTNAETSGNNPLSTTGQPMATPSNPTVPQALPNTKAQ